MDACAEDDCANKGDWGVTGLAEFLLTRIEEDKAAVYEADSDGEYRIAWMTITQPNGGLRYTTVASDHRDDEWCADGVNLRGAQRVMLEPQIVFDARRVLAECEAKRRIVDEFAPRLRMNGDFDGLFRALALPYADHPDYREEWKP
jgi:hypothetical protein